MGSLQAYEQHLDERSTTKPSKSWKRKRMSLKIILNQVRKVRIGKTKDKGFQIRPKRRNK